MNPLVCGPRTTRHPDAQKHPGGQHVLTGTAPEVYVQHPGELPINLQILPQPPQMLGRTQEHPMTHLQVDWPPHRFEDVPLAQLSEILLPDEAAFSLPGHDTMYLPNYHGMSSFGLGPYSSHPTPLFGGVEGMQNDIHNPRSYDDYAGEPSFPTCN